MSPVRSQPSGREHARRRLRIVEVAGEHVRAAQPDLAGVTDEGVATVVVHDPQLDPVEHPPDGPEHGSHPDRRRDDGRRLGQPVALGDADAEALGDPLGDAHRQLRRAGQGEADAGEGVGGRLVEVGEGHPQRRRAGDHGHAAGLDRLERGRRVEALHEDDGRTDREAEAEDDVEPEDVVARDDPVDDVARRDPARDRAGLGDVGQQVAVAEHRGAGCAGRAAREEQRGEVVGRDVDGRHRGSIEQVVERHIAGITVDRDDRAHGRDARRDRRPAQAPDAVRSTTTATGASAASSRCTSGAGLVGFNGAATAPRPTHREVGEHERMAVAADDRDPISVDDAEAGESAAQAVDAIAQLAVRDRLVAADQRDRGIVMVVDDARQVDARCCVTVAVPHAGSGW